MAQKRKKPVSKKSAARKASASQMENLAKLTALEMAGFVVLEIIVWLLILAKVVPPSIVIKQVGLLEISMNTGYFVIVGLVAVLVASFWLAILVQFNLIRLEKVEFKF